ncbi:MAG: YcfL family protein [Opitutae bacterium]|nr:YcfL family protein [Opitutae bacterium]
MKTTPPLLVLAALASAFLAGCQTEPGPFQPQDTTKYSIENTDKFVLMDRPTQISITCTGLQEPIRPDGRLEVIANIKNRENRRLQVQVRCVFKDEAGYSTGDETPWRTLILGENATEAVHFIAMNTLARKYTIAVRQAR